MRRVFFFWLIAALSCAAQSIKVDSPNDGKFVTLVLSYSADDPEFTATQCVWYHVNSEDEAAKAKDALKFIREGCKPFQRDFTEGKQETVALILNGHPTKYPHLSEQRQAVITIDIQPRVVVHKGRL